MFVPSFDYAQTS